MRGANTLIPARFLTLLGHLCVLITLLWESKQSVRHCLPNHFQDSLFQMYHSRLVAGLAASLVLIVIEFMTFLLGLTMFSPSVSLTSIGGHGTAAIVLTYFVLDGWLCDWFWPIFFFCSVLPSCVDLTTAVMVLFSSKWWDTYLYTGCRLGGYHRGAFFSREIVITNEHQHLTQTHDYRPGWSLYLVLAGVVTTLGSSLPVGFNIGVVNTPAKVIKQFCNESFVSRYELPLDETWLKVLWSSVVSIFIVGGCTGSILGSMLADKMGRKRATIVTSVISIAGALMFLFCRTANSVEMLIIGRLLVGLSGGLTTSIVPMYLTELAPRSLTGAMGVACPMGVNVGVLVGQVMGLNFLLGGADDWPYLLSVYVLLVIICLPVLFILPESPKYLFVVKRNEIESLRELSRVRGVSSSVLTDELEVLKEESRTSSVSSSEEDYGMLRVVQDSKMMLPLLLVCTAQAGQQTSGINAVFYYSQTIFKQAGLSDSNAQYATIGCGAINVCTAVLMLYLLPRFGRRPLLLGSMFCATAILAALAAALVFIEAVPWMPYVAMAGVLAYVLVYGFGLGPIPYFIASEIFEVAPRGAGMAWGSLANWGGNFLVGMCFPSLRDVIGPYCFLVFSALTGALFFFHRKYFPETKGKTPNQVMQLCSEGLKSRPLHSVPLHRV